MLRHVKKSAARLDYTVDWSDWLPAGDSISTSNWSVETGLTNDGESNSSTAALIWLTGGTAGKNYEVENSIVTADGRQNSYKFSVEILD